MLASSHRAQAGRLGRECVADVSTLYGRARARFQANRSSDSSASECGEVHGLSPADGVHGKLEFPRRASLAAGGIAVQIQRTVCCTSCAVGSPQKHCPLRDVCTYHRHISMPSAWCSAACSLVCILMIAGSARAEPRCRPECRGGRRYLRGPGRAFREPAPGTATARA
jgi:hypothetical protein